MLKEQRELAAQLRTARQTADPAAEMAARSTLFRERGLSLDTSLPPNLAIRDALEAVAAKGLLASGDVASAAVIGPGLDFADKDTGFDFYPVQTVQPFAVYEALLSTGLASRDRVNLFTLDLSPRVNQHLEAARARAARGDAYRLTLPIDRRSWTPAFLQFWKSFGERLGGADTTPPAAAAADLQVRAVRIAPAIVSRITPMDVNIVVDRSSSARFDLIVATNVFVYYSVFEQALALANVEAMLRPGGLLLTNTSLPASGAGMQSVGMSTTVYSDRPGDGDQVVWYRKSSIGPPRRPRRTRRDVVVLSPPEEQLQVLRELRGESKASRSHRSSRSTAVLMCFADTSFCTAAADSGRLLDTNR